MVICLRARTAAAHLGHFHRFCASSTSGLAKCASARGTLLSPRSSTSSDRSMYESYVLESYPQAGQCSWLRK
jgi:hypothetical protein